MGLIGGTSALVLVLALGAPANALSAARAAKAGCQKPSGAKLVARTRSVLLWRVTRGQASHFTDSIVACERSARRRWIIATSQGGEISFGNYRAAGHFVLFTGDSQIISSQTGGDQETLFVYDVHRRREAFQEDVAGTTAARECGPVPTCPSDTTTLDASVVNARGFAAWLTTHSQDQTITAHDHRGTKDVATHLAGVSHLALDGRTLRWRAQGRQHSTHLR